jgi:D-alanyl-D-alanine carboxypeptidase
MVVNNENPLPEDYEKPNLNELSANPSMELDEVAATQIEKFFADAQTAGYKYVITAAYRTATDQTDAYNTALQANLRAGYTTEEAEALASKSVAKAGESEYQTGLIISFTENRSMTAEEFMQTAFYKYISENIHKYGFVQRYPANKEAITGFSATPFVYRFVGDIESAEYIHRNGLSLEEYNDYISQQKAFAEQRLSSLKSGNS